LSAIVKPPMSNHEVSTKSGQLHDSTLVSAAISITECFAWWELWRVDTGHLLGHSSGTQIDFGICNLLILSWVVVAASNLTLSATRKITAPF
jgi:hypothetical protein